MANQGVQQQVSIQRLPQLLREVYEGTLLVPVTEQSSWVGDRRLKLLESVYRGVPIGSMTVCRTTVHLDVRQTLGGIPLRADGETKGPRTYLLEGIGRVATLFEELGPSFWQSDGSNRRPPPPPSERPRSRTMFDLRNQAFIVSEPDEPPRPTEFPLADLFLPERQHAFSTRVESLPDGERLSGRLVRLVDAFFDFSLPVITFVTKDPEVIQSLFSSRGKPAPASVDQCPKTTHWYCDACGERIKHPHDGWVEWLKRGVGSEGVGRGLRLVHHRPASPRPEGCQYDDRAEFQRDNSMLHDLALEYFLGANGLTLLLDMLSEGALPKEDVITMIQRLHTPGYERARFHFKNAIDEGIIEPNLSPGFYFQRQIAAVLAWADEEGRKP